MPALLALFALLAAIVAWPLFQAKDPDNAGLAAPLILLTVGAALIGLLNVHAPWTARHPRPTEVVYVADQTDGTFWRASLTPRLDDWSRAALTGDGGSLVKRAIAPLADGRAVDAAKAMAVPAIGPVMAPPGEEADGRRALTLTPAPGTQQIALTLRATAALKDVSLDGLPIGGLDKAGATAVIRWSSGRPLTLRYRPMGPGDLTVTALQVSPGWPAQARKLPVRPDNAMAYDISDSTVVRGEFKDRW